MGDYSHRIWTTDLDYNKVVLFEELLRGPWGATWEDVYKQGKYENRNYNQSLIVDKTKFTMGDAMYYNKIDATLITPWTFERNDYKNKKLEESNLPLIDVNAYNEWHFANERSKKEGLDTAYIRIYPNSKDAKKFILLGNPNLDYNSCKSCSMIAIDTSASGYRLPFQEEWMLLMRGGASTRYYWGEDSATVSSYEWVKPIGLKPVAQKKSNSLGLYDISGISSERIHYFYQKDGYWENKASCKSNLSPECTLMNEITTHIEYIEPESKECFIESGNTEWKTIIGDGKCTIKKSEVRTKKAYYESLRFLRKTPKLHKLEKF